MKIKNFKNYNLSIVFIVTIFIFNLFFSLSDQSINSTPEPVEVDLITRSIAISEIYGIYNGYVGHRSIYESFTNQKPYIDYISKPNKELIIHPFNYQEIKSVARNVKGDRKILLGFQDVGLVDFYKGSYLVFGINQLAPTLFYFLLLFSSVFFYVFFFKNDQSKINLLYFFSLAHFLMTFLIQDVGSELYHLYNRRYLPILSIIPTLHLSMALFENKFIDRQGLLFLFLQSLILISIFHFRGSSQYQLIFIALTTSLLFVYNFFNLKQAFNFKKYALPIILIFTCLLVVFKLINYLYISPFYNSERSGHLFWHAAYIGLSTHPQSEEKYNIITHDKTTGILVKSVTKKKYGHEDWSLVGGLDLFEKIVKDKYFEIIINDPKYALLNYTYKPIVYLQNFYDLLLNFDKLKLSLILIVFLLIIISTILKLEKGKLQIDNITYISVLIMAVLSFSPALMVVPKMYYTSETNLLFIMVIFMVFNIIITKAVKKFRNI